MRFARLIQHAPALSAAVTLLATAVGTPATWAQETDTAADPAKLPRTVVVATREVPPFSMRDEDGHWVGISIDLLREVQAELERETGQAMQLEFRELGLEDILSAVADGKANIGAAAITVNAERERRMDFTHPFHSSGLGIAVDARQTGGWTSVLTAIFSSDFLKIVGALLVALLLSAVAVYFFERRRNREDFGGGAIRGIGSGLWWAAVTLTTVGYGDKAPRSLPGRMIGLVWMFAGLFIIASFTAAATSALTLTRLQSRVSGPADLSKIKVATVEGSTSARYLRARHIIYRRHADVEEALASARAGDVDAVVYDASILRYQVRQRYLGELTVLPVTFERQDYAFAIPSNSPLRETINQILLDKINSAAWKGKLREYLGEAEE